METNKQTKKELIDCYNRALWTIPREYYAERLLKEYGYDIKKV
jgi:hypothetical protein